MQASTTTLLEPNHHVLFRETQRFTQPLIWMVILGCAAVMWWMSIHHVAAGRIGDNVGTDIFIAAFFLAFGVGLPALFLALQLITEVRQDGIYVRFVPFHRKWRRFGFDEVTNIESRTYSPLLDYGGWGLRLGPCGWAYNVKGTLGVHLTFNTGKQLLIGTQQPDAFMHTVNEARKA